MKARWRLHPAWVVCLAGTLALAACQGSSKSSVGAGLISDVSTDALTAGALRAGVATTCGQAGAQAATASTASNVSQTGNTALRVPTPPQSRLLSSSAARFGAAASTAISGTQSDAAAQGATTSSRSLSTAASASAVGAALAATPPLSSPTFRFYQSACTPEQLITFYEGALNGHGWTGSFDSPNSTPFAGVAQSTTSSAAPGTPAYSTTAPRVGNFIGVNASGATILFIEIYGAGATSVSSASSSASGPTNRPSGSTTVEVIEQPVPRQASSAGT